MTDVPGPLTSAPAGPPDAMRELFETLYRELHTLAHHQLRRGGAAPVLDTTALVHEMYVRLAGAAMFKTLDRQHFLAYAANAMRSVVVDIMRAQHADKRGAGATPVTLNTDLVDAMPTGADEVLRIHEALLELATIDGALVQVVEMRFFAGLSEEEIAAAIQLSSRTVRRQWQKARMFLRTRLSEQ